jgi:hypothetical protein
LPYTFINVGFWMQMTLPYPPSFPSHDFIDALYNFHGSGDVPNLLTDSVVIGDFVGRIIKDDRTLNKSILIHSDEVTIGEVWKIAQEVSPEGQEIVKKKRPVRSFLCAVHDRDINVSSR